MLRAARTRRRRRCRAAGPARCELRRRRGQRTAKFDLDARRWRSAPTGLPGALEYSTDLFDAATRRSGMAGHLRALLEAAVGAARTRRCRELPLLAEAERQQVLVEWNDTAARRTRARPCLHELVRGAGGADARTRWPWSFEGAAADLRASSNARANQLAHHLRRAGRGARGAGGPVRGALAGAWWWRCWASSRPAAPTCRWTRRYPRERLAFMLRGRAARRCCVTQERAARRAAPERRARSCCLDADAEALARRAATTAPDARRRAGATWPTSSTPRAPPAGPRASCVAAPGASSGWCASTDYVALGAGGRACAQASNASLRRGHVRDLGRAAARRRGWCVRAARDGARRRGAGRALLARAGHHRRCSLTTALFNQLAARGAGRLRGRCGSVLLRRRGGGPAARCARCCARGPPARLLQRLRPHREHHVRHLARGRRGAARARHGAHRPADRQHAAVRAGRARCSRCRVGVPGELYIGGDGPGARLPGPAGADGGALRARPVQRRARARGCTARATWCAGCRTARWSSWAASTTR